MGERDEPLSVKVDGGRLVISIGVDTLAWATRHAEHLMEYDEKSGEFLGYVISDPDEFARDVVIELEQEEEDGTTPVHLLLDKATEAAINNGSLGVAEERTVVRDA